MNDQEQPVVDHPGRSDGSLGSEGGESGNVFNKSVINRDSHLIF